MAKKKKKKKRPGPPRPQSAGPSRPVPAEGATAAPATEPREQRRTAAKERREAQIRARRAQQRRKQMRNIGIVVVIVAAIVAYAVVRAQQSGKVAQRAEKLAAAAGCDKIKEFDASGANQHMQPGEPGPKYDSSPPTHGKHAGNWLKAGVQTEPLTEDAASGRSIYQAVHSLEHGAVIMWHKDLSEDDLKAIEKKYENEKKVIVVPYAQLDGRKMALTSWGRLQTCKNADPKVIDSFIDRFRESDKAPEAKVQL